MKGDLLDEFEMADGLVTWCTYGPVGRVWAIMWNPRTQIVQAWRVPGGRNCPHRERAADLETAREKARLIAGLIAEGRRKHPS